MEGSESPQALAGWEVDRVRAKAGNNPSSSCSLCVYSWRNSSLWLHLEKAGVTAASAPRSESLHKQELLKQLGTITNGPKDAKKACLCYFQVTHTVLSWIK